MPRRPDPTSKLSDAEKHVLIKLIQADKPMPEKYRFLLFEDKRGANWSGTARARTCAT